VTATRLQEAFAEEGVRLTWDGECAGVTIFTNTTVAPDVDEGSGYEKVGRVFCNVSRQAPAAAADGVVRLRHAGDEETIVSVSNIDCAVYPSSADPEGQIASVEEILRKFV
jgi:hypothetical protein